MRKWGFIVSTVYAFIVIALLIPAGLLIAGDVRFPEFFHDLEELYAQWFLWVPVFMLIVGQATLLFLSVDTSGKRLQPRAPLIRPVIVTSMLLLLMTVAACACAGVAIYGDEPDRKLPGNPVWVFVGMGLVWAGWGVLFYLHARGKTPAASQAVKWLLRGSVLELLIAVPCHVIVRRRDDCCAPLATSCGITTGIAVMLIAFGPTVLLLYKKRLDAYRAGTKEQPVAP